MTERYLPMNISYKKKMFDEVVREALHLATWKDIDRLIRIMECIGAWDTIVTVVE